MPKASYAPDLFDRLGLDPNADGRQIRRQYRLLARLFHPDVSEAPDARDRFQKLQEAYGVLGEDEPREDYVRWLHGAEAPLRPLHMTLALWPPTLVRGSGKQRLYALLDINADPAVGAGHTPLNVVLVLDRSSSMKGRRLHYVKEAARRIVDNLSKHDVFGVVSFNDRARVVLPAGPATDASVARQAIDSIQPAGGTELAQGLRAGVQELLRYHGGRYLSHLILLTDGRTYGDEAIALDMAERAGEQGIGITGMGLGTDWNDEFLDDLAQRGGGQAHFIAEPDQAVALFQSQLQQLQRTYARHASLKITLGSEIQLLQAHEIAPGLRPLLMQEGALNLGSLPADPPLRLLVELAVPLPIRDVALLAEFALSAQLMQDSQSYGVARIAVADVDDAAAEEVPRAIFQAAQRVATLRLQHRTWESIAQGKEGEQTVEALDYLANRFLELGATDLATATQQEKENYQRTGALTDNGRMAIKYGTRMLSLPSPQDEPGVEPGVEP